MLFILFKLEFFIFYKSFIVLIYIGDKILNKININKSNILVFDLDGTLLNTDLANFLSYKQVYLISLKLSYQMLLVE